MLPVQFDGLIENQKIIMAYEAARNYVFETTCHPGQLSEAFTALTDIGRKLGQQDYRQAKDALRLARGLLHSLVPEVDAWIAPAAIGEAPLATAGTGDPLMSRMWTALKGPSLCIPVSMGEQGLPLGAQLLALPGDDDRLLQVGQWIEHLLENP